MGVALICSFNNCTLQYEIRDKWLVFKALLVLAYILGMYLVHALLHARLQRPSIGWLMLSAALLLVVLADNGAQMPRLLHQVDWESLLLVFALFVLMLCVDSLNLLVHLSSMLEKQLSDISRDWLRYTMTIVTIVWAYGPLAAICNNNIVTISMLHSVENLIEKNKFDALPIIVTFALAMGLGGSGCMFGSVSNILAVGIAERHGVRVSFWKFLRYSCIRIG